MLYEYRVYETMPGKLPELHERFRAHTLRIFERHGIKNIGYWTSNAGGYSDQLIYIVAFENAAQREKAWSNFFEDQEWQNIRNQSEADGPLIARISNVLLSPTDYSPLR